jgi:hypothetical protein
MHTTGTTHLIRDSGMSVIACDVPPEMTLAEYRGSRHARPNLRQRMRTAILGPRESR